MAAFGLCWETPSEDPAGTMTAEDSAVDLVAAAAVSVVDSAAVSVGEALAEAAPAAVGKRICI